MLFWVSSLHCPYHILCLLLPLPHSICCSPSLTPLEILAPSGTQPLPSCLHWEATQSTQLGVGALGPPAVRPSSDSFRASLPQSGSIWPVVPYNSKRWLFYYPLRSNLSLTFQSKSSLITLSISFLSFSIFIKVWLAYLCCPYCWTHTFVQD